MSTAPRQQRILASLHQRQAGLGCDRQASFVFRVSSYHHWSQFQAIQRVLELHCERTVGLIAWDFDRGSGDSFDSV
jgi:hypothetical protein